MGFDFFCCLQSHRTNCSNPPRALGFRACLLLWSLHHKNGERISEEMTMLLYRHMMIIGCEPGVVGAMSTGSSPLDPIFWVLHPAFEKASHILELAENYRDTYDFEWVDSDCGSKLGGKITDTFPFTGVHGVGGLGWVGGCVRKHARASSILLTLS